MDTASYDWTTFSVRMYYRSDIERVWAAWATPDGLESFFIETCSATTAGRPLHRRDVFEPGTRFRWTWRHGHQIEGVITDVVEFQRLGFTFGGMNVQVSIAETADGTMVLLEQSEIPATEEGRVWGHLNCRSCWVFFMTNLASVLESGRDLRHDNPRVTSSMEVGFLPPPEQTTVSGACERS